MAGWNASQYLKFVGDRTRPAADLLAQVPLQRPGSVVDLGCGPGNSTALLAERFPDARVLGIDSDPDMIASARKALPGTAFDLLRIEDWQPQTPPDLIFANASLQWVGDHATLLPHLVSLLAPGGVLAVQMPDTLEQPTHVKLAELGRDPRWSARTAAAAADRAPLLTMPETHALLRGRGVALNLWRTTYFHELTDLDAIVEWFRGSALRPYLEMLTPDEQVVFLSEYRAAIAPFYPAGPAGVLLPFPRVFVVAQRPMAR